MESRIFKGATRPPLVLGVPVQPMVILSMGTLLPLGYLAMLQFYTVSILLVIVFLLAFLWMRVLTKQDPWRLKQEILRLSELRMSKGNIDIWGGVSYGPHELTKRKGFKWQSVPNA